MNIQPQSEQSQSISDDQELAKVLAGVNGEAEQTDETAIPEPMVPPTPMPLAPPVVDTPVEDSAVLPIEPEPTALPDPVMPPMPVASMPGDANLDGIKQQALVNLRPLIDKLDVSPEEKFDTYLLLIRSTDDKDLVSPAHEAAKSITDETRRAQALLDIIKEIDFLSNPQPNQQ